MLLCGIIEDLKKTPGENSNLGYFFCQATDSRINSASSVVAGLIFSLVKQNQTLFSPICKEYEDKLSQLNGPNAWAVLGDIFEAVTQVEGISAPICVVDALDECEHDCKLLLRLIIKTSNHVKWLLSSRNVKYIERRLRLIEPARRLSLELKENAENVSKSVDIYINNSISGIETLEDDEELQIKTITTLKHKANGTFLWVALVIEQLRDTDRRNVEEVLEEIPEGLENLYDLILQQANAKLRQKDREACQILLSIVTTAERPLHLEELDTFVSSQWAHYKPSYNILDMQDIVKDCGSLLAIRDNTVYFIHQSVKDYIVGNAYNSIFPLGIQHQHRKMFETSMSVMYRTLKQDIYNLKDPQRYMGNVRRKGHIWQLRDIEHKDDIRPPHPDPLLPIAYSCVFWVDHLIHGYDSKGFKSEGCFRGDGLLQTFLKTKYLCWLEALALLRSLTSEGGSALQKLNKLAASYCKSRENEHQGTNSQEEEEEETNCLVKLVGDAYRFFHYCQDFVKKWPLQLYSSAIIFEDKYSTIYKIYRQSIRAQFGDFCTIIKKPQRRLFLQHNIDTSNYGASLLYSPDSSTLCVFNRCISLYRTDSMERAIHLSVDSTYCHYVSFLPDSRNMISVSSTGVVQTWAIDSGIQMQHLSLPLDLRKSYKKYSIGVLHEEVICLSPHGDLAASIVCTSSDNLSWMKIWKTKTAACVCELDLGYIPNDLVSYAFASNSALIALTRAEDIRIYSVWAGNMVKHIRTPRYVGHSRFSQDSALLAFASGSSSIELWCTESWTMIHSIETGVSIQDFDLSLDASMFVANSRTTLAIGSTRTKEQLLNIVIGDETENASFSPDWPTSSLLASVNSSTVQIWRVDTRNSSAEMRSAAYSESSVVISPGSEYVAARSLKGHIDIWCSKSGERIQTLKGGDSYLNLSVFSPNLEYVACTEGNFADVRIWHLTTGESLHLLENSNVDSAMGKMVFSDDSKYLVTGYGGWENKEARVWCAESGKCVFKSNENDDDDGYGLNYGHIDIVALAISPDTRYVARASMKELIQGNHNVWEYEVRIWDWRACRDISSFDPNQAKRENYLHILSIDFSSDATILAIISATSGTNHIPTYEAKIWEVATSTFITCVAIGESFSEPLFDPITNKILTDRAGFWKRTSWEHWERFSWRAYSLWRPNMNSSWVYFGGEKIFLIPQEFFPKYESGDSVVTSSSLLAYTTSADEIMIIQLPSQHELQKLGIIAVDSDNVGDSSLRTDGSSSEVVS